MCWLKAPRAVLGFSLALLLTIAGPFGKTASAQEAGTSGFDVNAPVTSLRTADLSTEQQRIRLATKLLEARADTKISHDAYRKGILYFQNHHPGFYGNFFGDPFYATYDVDYLKMARHRRLASYEVNPPETELSKMFFCNPLGYDPAFNGQCRGYTFAAFDFLLLPSGLTPETTFGATSLHSGFLLAGHSPPKGARFHPYVGNVHPYANYNCRATVQDRPDDRPQRSDARKEEARRTPPREPDLPPRGAQESSSTSSSASTEKATSADQTAPIRTLDRPALQIEGVSENVYTSIQETTESLQRTETKLRLQRHIREEYGGRDNLSPRERAELTRRLSRTAYSSERQNGTSSQRSASSERERLPEQVNYERPLQRASAPRTTTERTDRSRSASSPSRTDSGSDRSDVGSSGSTSRPTTDTPDRDRPARSESSSEKEIDEG